jgi:hypothetical protein
MNNLNDNFIDDDLVNEQDKINELTQLFIDNDVKSVNQGEGVLKTYFDGFQFHLLKDEYMNMKRDERRKFIKTLLESNSNPDDNTSKIDSQAIPNEIA